MGDIIYHISPGVEPKRVGKRFYLILPSGGRVVIDRYMLNLWQEAKGRNFTELMAFESRNELERECKRASLACLAEAGLLARGSLSQVVSPVPTLHSEVYEAKVSVIIVAYNSRMWLPECLVSLAFQTCPVDEIIVVDNASTDGLEDWLREYAPQVHSIRLEQPTSLAAAFNRGIEAAHGEFILLLNPDVKVEPQAIAQMVRTARETPNCAVVAAKLRFLWAPNFLNGVGNFVGAFSWGSDIGIGHLDLGQFDHWQEVPSACFAAALISASAWHDVGPLDEGLPLYYEDSEWCYRARLMGYSIRFAPDAVVYHAMGSRHSVELNEGLSLNKVQQVTYGRLRFATRLLGFGYFIRFLLSYFLEDSFNCVGNLLLGRWNKSRSILRAWREYLACIPQLMKERSMIQSRRRVGDQELFRIQLDLPSPLVWRGIPLLTKDIAFYHYLPLILNGQTRFIPEFSMAARDGAFKRQIIPRRYSLRRVVDILREEGAMGLLQRTWRAVQKFLMRP